MDRHEHEELNDDLLARDIEAALDVDPSPEFRARVRARVVRARIDESWMWSGRWRLAGAGLVATAAAVIGLWIVREPMPAPLRGTLAGESRDLKPAPRDSGIAAPVLEPRLPKPESVAAGIASSNVSKPIDPVRPARVAQPPFASAVLLISQEEAAALRQFFTEISNGRFDPAVLPDLDASLQPPPAIPALVVEPISLRPLAELESE